MRVLRNFLRVNVLERIPARSTVIAGDYILGGPKERVGHEAETHSHLLVSPRRSHSVVNYGKDALPF